MAQGTAPAPSRRTTSHSGSARLSLSVGKANAGTPNAGTNRHPLRQDWSISYVHRAHGAKVDYEKEIRKVATFGSIESFLHLYSHLTPPNELPPVTDVLVFVSRIGRPGVWEEMRDGGKFTLRLVHPITPILYESLLLSLIGDQFEESDNVVGCVLSVRQTEDILSVWVEEEGESVRSGALKEKILSLLGLPPTTMCEYRANRALLDAASKPPFNALNSYSTPQAENANEHPLPQRHTHNHERTHTHTHTHGGRRGGGDRDREHGHGGYGHRGDRDRERDRDGNDREGQKERTDGWGGHRESGRRAAAGTGTGVGATAAAAAGGNTGPGAGSIW